MKHEENSNLYLADEGHLFVRKSDNFIMGGGIDLGEVDPIDNYEEREFTKEEIDAFWKSIGQENPKKHYAEQPNQSTTQE